VFFEASLYIPGIEAWFAYYPNNNSVFSTADDVDLCRADTQIEFPSRSEINIEPMMCEIIFDLDFVLWVTRNGQNKQHGHNRNA
jgi:hypothetical protein